MPDGKPVGTFSQKGCLWHTSKPAGGKVKGYPPTAGTFPYDSIEDMLAPSSVQHLVALASSFDETLFSHPHDIAYADPRGPSGTSSYHQLPHRDHYVTSPGKNWQDMIGKAPKL